MKKEKALDKIRKMIAHKESAEKIGSVEEAAAFAEKIGRLLVEWRVSEEEARRGAPMKYEIGGLRADETMIYKMTEDKRTAILFCTAVFEGYGCVFVTERSYEKGTVIGTDTDQEIAWRMLAFLEIECLRALVSSGVAYRVPRVAMSFIRGFMEKISERLKSVAKVGESSVTALTVSRLNGIKKWLKDEKGIGTETSGPDRRRVDNDAAYLGARAASRIGLVAGRIGREGKALEEGK